LVARWVTNNRLDIMVCYGAKIAEAKALFSNGTFHFKHNIEITDKFSRPLSFINQAIEWAEQGGATELTIFLNDKFKDAP